VAFLAKVVNHLCSNKACAADDYDLHNLIFNFWIVFVVFPIRPTKCQNIKLLIVNNDGDYDPSVFHFI